MAKRQFPHMPIDLESAVNGVHSNAFDIMFDQKKFKRASRKTSRSPERLEERCQPCLDRGHLVCQGNQACTIIIFTALFGYHSNSTNRKCMIIMQNYCMKAVIFVYCHQLENESLAQFAKWPSLQDSSVCKWVTFAKGRSQSANWPFWIPTFLGNGPYANWTGVIAKSPNWSFFAIWVHCKLGY